MTRPEEALARAREEAARGRAEGAYPDDALPDVAVEPAERVTIDRLLDWALIEPDPELVYSTRRLGAPVTWVKKGLLRALWQYHRQITDQQTRFNIGLVTFVAELDDRVRRLEERAGDAGPPGP